MMRRVLVLGGVVGLLLAVPVMKFYVEEIHYARELVRERDLPANYQNALQHAHAAARSYKTLRLALSKDQAEWAILTLGTINEYFERLNNYGDNTGEVMKDYHNNQVGLMVGRWQDEYPDAPISELLIGMAQEGVLMLNAPLTGDVSPDIAQARAWFGRERAVIRQLAQDWLASNARPRGVQPSV